jgi:hypothetical protein
MSRFVFFDALADIEFKSVARIGIENDRRLCFLFFLVCKPVLLVAGGWPSFLTNALSVWVESFILGCSP